MSPQQPESEPHGLRLRAKSPGDECAFAGEMCIAEALRPLHGASFAPPRLVPERGGVVLMTRPHSAGIACEFGTKDWRIPIFPRDHRAALKVSVQCKSPAKTFLSKDKDSKKAKKSGNSQSRC